MDILNFIYKETNGKLWPFLKLYRLMKEKGMSIEQVVNAVEIAIHKLPHMESLYEQVKDQVDKMQHTRQMLANEIAGLERKISVLDKTAFSSEQECKRTEQRVLDLTAKKDRLEKLIANMLNGEGYLKLNQIAKASVKAILAENKKLISISFVALIQTLKNDPQMVNLICNIPTANTDEQHKGNNNNYIIKYIESNKDRILDLTEKNYENLIEAFTNNAISNAAASSSHPTLSLPQSSSTFRYLSTQSDTYRIEDPENFRNSRGDIGD
jgi:cell division septum initiation protein DivIVA